MHCILIYQALERWNVWSYWSTTLSKCSCNFSNTLKRLWPKWRHQAQA